MEQGKVLLCDAPRNIGERLGAIQKEHPMFRGLPSAVRIFHAVGINEECPLTVKEGRDFLERHFAGGYGQIEPAEPALAKETAVELKNVWFRYERDLPDILRGTSVQVFRGERFCILGGNGTGKTTMLNVIAGLNKAYRGKVLINGKLIRDYKGNSLYRKNMAFLPQNPQTVFIKDTVRADFGDILEGMEVARKDRIGRIEAIAEKIGILPLLDRHPFDLSGGEQQKCALAKMLLLEPAILLLDEPTKGLDAFSKHQLKGILNGLKQEGITVLMVTHDVEFAAEIADRCALFFDGEVLSSDIPSRFFAENNFYTTAANRMARSLWPNAVTCEQVVSCCRAEGEV